MGSDGMRLIIKLPARAFLDQPDVVSVCAESESGSFGILPRRMDCIAALVPGILSYRTADGKEFHVAIDEGILLKTGGEVLVSVRNAIGDVPLEHLKVLVDSEMKQIDEREAALRRSIALLESSLFGSFKDSG